MVVFTRRRASHTHAYAISWRGAALMLRKAAEDGIICGLDWFMAIHMRYTVVAPAF